MRLPAAPQRRVDHEPRPAAHRRARRAVHGDRAWTLLIAFGKSHYDSTAVGSSIGLTAFALMIVVSAYESRSVCAVDAAPARPSTTAR